MALSSEEVVGSGSPYVYDEWMEGLGLPVYRGHFVPDLRTIDLGHWDERGCDAAFVQLVGQQGLSEARITEIPATEASRPYKMAVDEIVYVVSGHGTTVLWGDGQRPEDGHFFEWNERALFLVPGQLNRQFFNIEQAGSLRLLHYNYLPLAMSVVPDPEFFFSNPYPHTVSRDQLRQVYGDATLADGSANRWRPGGQLSGDCWLGNFFPDMRAWDKLDLNRRRGAGGSTVSIQFAKSAMTCHMSMFGEKKYKKAHRHGPGRVIVIPTGEGYSVMWPEGGERVVVPWQENALFVPPDRWFHQHFNLGDKPARYLAFHPPTQFHGYSERAEDRHRDQIEYPDEDPWIRQHFEEELAARGLTTDMPSGAYRDPGYSWR